MLPVNRVVPGSEKFGTGVNPGVVMIFQAKTFQQPVQSVIVNDPRAVPPSEKITFSSVKVIAEAKAQEHFMRALATITAVASFDMAACFHQDRPYVARSDTPSFPRRMINGARHNVSRSTISRLTA
jgi:hypothetical protein